MDFSKLNVPRSDHSFPVDYSGAVYSFGLPGKDEVDQTPRTEAPSLTVGTSRPSD